MFSTLTIAALAAAAQSAPPAEVRTLTAPVAPGSPAATPRAYSPRTRFCVMGELSGSRVPRKVCQTRDAWLDQGFDPLTAKRWR